MIQKFQEDSDGTRTLRSQVPEWMAALDALPTKSIDDDVLYETQAGRKLDLDEGLELLRAGRIVYFTTWKQKADPRSRALVILEARLDAMCGPVKPENLHAHQAARDRLIDQIEALKGIGPPLPLTAAGEARCRVETTRGVKRDEV